MKFIKSKIEGKKINNFILLGRIKSKKGTRIFLAKCKCGNKFKINSSNFYGKNATKSCGCLKIKHGHTINKNKTFEYNCWDNMKRRSLPKYKQFWRSGNYHKINNGNKIICNEWLNFNNFINDMGKAPSDNYSIERIDNNKGYCKENCKWELKINQPKNTSRTIFYEENGVIMCLFDWCKRLNVNYNTVRSRIRSGYSLKESLYFNVDK